MLRMLRKTMATLEDKTCIEFVHRTDEDDYINITYTESGCFAHVGHMNRGAQVKQRTLCGHYFLHG